MSLLKLILVPVFVVSLPWASAADFGGSALLNAVGGSQPQTSTATTSNESAAPSIVAFKPEDAVQSQLLLRLQTDYSLSFEMKTWMTQILQQKFASAAHQWTSVKKQLPDSLARLGAVTQTYLLWKLNLPQTFFNSWVEKLRSPEFVNSQEEYALEQVVGANLDSWLLDHAVLVNAEQKAIIQAIPPSNHLSMATLKGWVSLRQGEEGKAVLAQLPKTNKLVLPLGRTVMLAEAKSGDVQKAGKTIQSYIEPAIATIHDPKALASHYLDIARLLYQVGSLDAAENYYERIPNGAPEFLEAREELAWVWLRSGNVDRLRGELVSLGSPLFQDRFDPELNVVRAVSNLKLCYFTEVEKSFKDFMSQNSKWAKQIGEALKAKETPAPDHPDSFSVLAETAVKLRFDEADRLQKLGEESITAVLPAVGIQPHWGEAQKKLSVALEEARKQRAWEYGRQWRNERETLIESIQKMRFVKVELLSEIRMSAGSGGQGNSDQISLSKAGAVHMNPDDQEFAFDGVMWPDELFRLHSFAPGRCVAEGSGK